MTPGLLLELPRTEYGTALALQERLVEARRRDAIPETLVLVEHPPVFTLGRRARREDVYLADAELARRGIGLYRSNRGGLVTYHGPGQVVGYPIARLRALGRYVPAYVAGLQRLIAAALAEIGVDAAARPGLPGVWTGRGKIAAIGVAMVHGVTMHGFAVNLQPELAHFELIDPCGLREQGVTSAAALLGRPLDAADFRARLARHFEQEFEVALRPSSLADVFAQRRVAFEAVSG
jgi:lipoate-protein ligase B